MGEDAILDARGELEIGHDVNISSGVHIWTMDHDPQDLKFGARFASVTVGCHVWLSERCTVLPGVTIGQAAVVAAGAVVTRDVLPYQIVGGVPARPIGQRRAPMTYNLLSGRRAKPPWW